MTWHLSGRGSEQQGKEHFRQKKQLVCKDNPGHGFRFTSKFNRKSSGRTVHCIRDLSVTGQRTHLSPVNFSSNEGTAVFRIAMCSFKWNGAFLGSWLAKLGEAGARVLKTQWSSRPQASAF